MPNVPGKNTGPQASTLYHTCTHQDGIMQSTRNVKTRTGHFLSLSLSLIDESFLSSISLRVAGWLCLNEPSQMQLLHDRVTRCGSTAESRVAQHFLACVTGRQTCCDSPEFLTETQRERGRDREKGLDWTGLNERVCLWIQYAISV